MPRAADQTPTADATPDQTALLPGLHAPLQHLVAAAELLERQRLTPEARACARAILDSGRTLLNVVEDLARLNGAAQSATAVRPCVLADLVEDVESLWRLQTAPSAGRLLISCPAPPGTTLELAADAFKQLANTLIRRALASEGGVVEVQIAMTAAGAGGDLRLSVSQGPSAPTASDSALMLAEMLAGSLGGTLRRTANPGVGEQLAAEVPVRLIAEADAELEPDPAVLPEQTHVLIVDDNATNRMVAAALCETFGCTTETAEDGVEAVEAARSTRFDLILMDIRMPRMDGVEATRAIRRLPGGLGRTPIVALTANCDPEAARLYLAAGMNGVVEKPIKPEKLLSTLQAVLEPETAAAASISAA